MAMVDQMLMPMVDQMLMPMVGQMLMPMVDQMFMAMLDQMFMAMLDQMFMAMLDQMLDEILHLMQRPVRQHTSRYIRGMIPEHRHRKSLLPWHVGALSKHGKRGIPMSTRVIWRSPIHGSITPKFQTKP
jgi:hypothetical protein